MTKDKKEYKITIMLMTEETEIKQGSWQCVGEELITQKEIDDANYNKRFEVEQTIAEGKFPIVKKYGYPPERAEVITKETKIYEQVVNTMDLVRVINAVNYIQQPQIQGEQTPRLGQIVKTDIPK